MLLGWIFGASAGTASVAAAVSVKCASSSSVHAASASPRIVCFYKRDALLRSLRDEVIIYNRFLSTASVAAAVSVKCA